jgi:hypothetical protein
MAFLDLILRVHLEQFFILYPSSWNIPHSPVLGKKPTLRKIISIKLKHQNFSFLGISKGVKN